MFLSNLNGFNSSPSSPIQGFNQKKGSSRVWNEKGSDSITFLFLSSYFCVCITYVFYFLVLSQSSFYALLCLICFCLVIFSVFLCFIFHIKIKKKITKTVCVLCTLVLVYLGWPLKQKFLNFVSLVA